MPEYNAQQPITIGMVSIESHLDFIFLCVKFKRQDREEQGLKEENANLKEMEANDMKIRQMSFDHRQLFMYRQKVFFMVLSSEAKQSQIKTF